MLRIRRMVIEEQGIRLSPGQPRISWAELLSCEEDSEAGMLVIRVSNGQQLVLGKVDVRNYDEVRQAVSTKLHIEPKRLL